MRSARLILRNPLCLASMLLRRYGTRVLSDRTYIKLLYLFEQGKVLNLKHPTLFTEKLQWLKLYNRNAMQTRMVDKLLVKQYISDLIGERYVTKTYGVWERFDDIDFSKLPESFVLKSNNGSGGAVYICRDKTTLDVAKARSIVESTRMGNVGKTYKEWPYLNIEPKIFAEELLADGGNGDLTDYKFFCFNGQPLYCQVICDRTTVETIDFYDMNWQHQPFVGLNPNCRNSGKILPVPPNFEEMKSLAAKISHGHPFLRVDLYNINGCIYFGETTFFPASGLGRFTPAEYDRKLGNLLNLEA